MNPLEPYLPYIKYALIAIIPALLVYLIEQKTITSLKTQLAVATEVAAANTPPTHIFTSRNLADLGTLETESAQFTQAIDQYRPANNNINELICMQGMRNSASSYITNMIGQVYQQMNASINSSSQDDMKFADRQMLGTVSSTIKFIPYIKENLRQMANSCRGSQTVSYNGSVIMRFIDTKLQPAFTAIQGKIAKAKY